MPETETGYSDASEVAVDPTGQYVLVSNRYTDSMAVYRIDPLTGYLRTAGFTPALAKLPASSALARTGIVMLLMKTAIRSWSLHLTPAREGLRPR